MEAFSGWYERYEKGVLRRVGGDLLNISKSYHPDYHKVVKVIEASFTDPIRINDVLWDQLVQADRRIRRSSLERVCNHGWEGQEELMTVLHELVLEGKKPFSLDDYL